MTGQRLGHFEVLGKLGEGGMGVVYKARDLQLDRPVALKILPPDKLGDPARDARFVQEAKAASALNHPGIVTIHEIGSSEGARFIAMEFIDGRTLDALIQPGGLRLKEALGYAIQIADALAAAHAAGIVHRDLKPANIMVTARGHVKILDFGLAKLNEPSSIAEAEATRTQLALTQEGTVAGSAPYMSPEQAEGRPVDARSDIFSFGSVLHEMLTGRRAFQGDSRISTLAAVLKSEPPSVSQIDPRLPKEMDRIVARCLRKDLARRSQSMAEVRLSLEELQAESSSSIATAPRAPKRHPAWLAAPAAVALLGLGAWLLLPRDGPPRQPPRITPLTALPGVEVNPTFSPDGNQFAFSWDNGGAEPQRIYFSLVGNVNPILLTKDPGFTMRPSWSPDGQSIAFYRLDAGKATLRTIPALGGPERTICDVIARGSIAWRPDSRAVFIGDSEGPESRRARSALFVVSLDGVRTKITSPSQGDYFGDHSPVVSPDGSRLAFVRMIAEFVSEIYVADIGADGKPAGEPLQLTNQQDYAAGPAWTPDGRGILYLSGDRSGRRTVYRVPANGGEPRPIPLPPDTEEIATSRTGRMILRSETEDHNLWSGELDAKGNLTGTPAPFASSTRYEASPAYSPDGKRLAFSSNRTGSRQIWVSDADGSNAVAVTAFPQGIAGSPRWSPDSKWIAFDARPTANVDVYVVSASGGEPKRLTDHPAADSVPAWSPDGKWIYFCSTRTGTRLAFRMPSAGGEATQITKNGCYLPMLSPDGKWLYYSFDQGIWRVPAEGGEETRLDRALEFAWTLAPRGVIYTQLQPAENQTGRNDFVLNYRSFDDRASRTIGKFAKPPGLHLSVTPGGKRLAWSQTDDRNSDLLLVDNMR